MILTARPDGLPWLVAHDPDTRVIAFAPAPPRWASAEAAAAISAALRAAVAGRCADCSAVRPFAPPGPWTVRVYVLGWSHGSTRHQDGGALPASDAAVPHAAWCPSSTASVLRAVEACRSQGERWAPDMDSAVIERLEDYIADLAERLTGAGSP